MVATLVNGKENAKERDVFFFLWGKWLNQWPKAL